MSMVTVSSSKDDINKVNTIIARDERLLKSALIFGANASGKSNLIKSIFLMKNIVLNSMQNIDGKILKTIVPFLLDQNNLKKPSEMEVIFYNEEIKYRYGFSIMNGGIVEEWLYYTPTTRETMLFERNNFSIEYNKASFKEASLFVKNGNIDKTREDVPFISVLAGFDGEHSKRVVNWFGKISVLSGIDENKFSGITHELLSESEDFKIWLKKILSSFQINDVFLDEITPEFPFGNIKTEDDNIKNLFNSLNIYAKSKKIFSINIVKKTINGDEITVPIDFESAGTKKIIYLLGPIYNAIKNGTILVIDEMDSKFHTLLSRFLFKMFHSQDESGSQIIAAVQDVNLMATECFRRDQIWFVDKNIYGSSQLYSLVEYKEKQRVLKDSYGQDYLKGAFSAIPLFDDIKQIQNLMPE
ncbi:AAA family ATPase [Serratia fonticola]|uniref:AAA family ATPase n=1 Tax=Serratia fonticola TaxID=47917 RepID=UPI003AAA680F